MNKFISDLKFRASIGKTGNQEGIGDYEWQTVYESGSDYNNDPGLTIPSTQPNPNLTWEKTTQYDAGFDASLFSHRIDLTFDWYRKNTHDLLLNHSVNGLTGYSDRTDNVGSLYNRDAAGKEAVLQLRCYQTGETSGSRPTASDAMNISDDGHELLWPIPTVAMDNDSALTQNNGY